MIRLGTLEWQHRETDLRRLAEKPRGRTVLCLNGCSRCENHKFSFPFVLGSPLCHHLHDGPH
jgi:hypothetical protein